MHMHIQIHAPNKNVYVYIDIYIYIYIYVHTYIPACLPACLPACMHACMHTYIHILFSEKRTKRTVSVSKPNFFYISPSALGPVACFHTIIRKTRQDRLGMVYPLPQPLIFFKLYGEGTISPNLAQGHHAILSRYNTDTEPTWYEKCAGPGATPSTPRGSTTPFNTIQRQHCLQPLGLAGPMNQTKNT